MKRLIAILAVSAVFLSAYGCGQKPALEKGVSADKAPDLSLTDIDGKVFKLSDYSRKVIILNFFATWCPPCRMEMPDFNEISETYKKDAVVIAVNVSGESLTKVQGFARENNLKFRISIDDGRAVKAYGPINAIPATFVIDKKFNIAKKYIGARSKEVFVKDIESLR